WPSFWALKLCCSQTGASPTRMLRLRGSLWVSLGVAIFLSSCAKSPSAPSGGIGLRVTAISPATGTTFGGTEVTLTGANLAADAAVTIGGAAATIVKVSSPTSMTVKTAQRAKGVVDVVVTKGDLTAK